MSQPEPRNPFYLLLLLVGLLFVVTLLAVVMVPILMDKAQAAGGDVPKEGFHQIIKRDGIWWVVAELVALILLSLASMGLDRLRTLKKDRAARTIRPNNEESDVGVSPGG
jgi:heme/copper-type cytochrome/quinol oxidase subunit 2